MHISAVIHFSIICPLTIFTHTSHVIYIHTHYHTHITYHTSHNHNHTHDHTYTLSHTLPPHYHTLILHTSELSHLSRGDGLFGCEGGASAWQWHREHRPSQTVEAFHKTECPNQRPSRTGNVYNINIVFKIFRYSSCY